MEGKWIAICVIGVVAAMFAPLIFTEQAKGQCRIEAIKAGKPADEIVKICK